MNSEPEGFVTRLIPMESETCRNRELRDIFQVPAHHQQASAFFGEVAHLFLIKREM